MIDFQSDFLNTPVRSGVTLAFQFIVWVPVVYLTIRGVCSLSTAGRWKLVKVALTILFLPFVLLGSCRGQLVWAGPRRRRQVDAFTHSRRVQLR